MRDLEFDAEFQSQDPGDSGRPPFPRSAETGEPSRIRPPRGTKAVGILVSGGLDSCILTKYLLDNDYRVQPFYIRGGLAWQAAEQAALERFLSAVSCSRLESLVVLDLPMEDIYGEHWSVTGLGVPSADTADEAVYLPGRVALLTIKAAIWCQLHGIGDLALAMLGTNPFADATAPSLERLGAALSSMGSRPIRLLRPFGEFNKQRVMELGRGFPLHLTFSCIAPHDGAHCGRCNKCAERREAFRLIGRVESPNIYA
jgi:7-cyano-7-deazaguanine synthase